MIKTLKLIGLLIAISASACATRPTPLLLPTGSAIEGAKTVNVLTVSTREKSTLPGQVYTGERGETATMMAIEVSIPPTHAKGVIDLISDLLTAVNLQGAGGTSMTDAENNFLIRVTKDLEYTVEEVGN